jgi:hypothetical protein
MGKETIYYFFVLLTFLYIIFKNRNSSIKILITLCFYSGLASFSGKAIENPYKIALVIFSIYLLFKHGGLSGLTGRARFLLFVFALFSFSFLLSAYINGDYFNLTFSQYGKYVTPFCLFFVLNHILIRNPVAFTKLKKLFISLLTIQIILSVLKVLVIGLSESIVGSISYIGGGLATMLPVLGFILVWLHKQGELSRKDWLYILLLLIIAFASSKRAIWFIMPVFIILFMYYIPRKIKTSHLLYVISLAPLILYMGIRLNPTLNKEHKVGGSFNLGYAIDYTQKYSFGKTTETSDIQLGSGRGGATILLFSKVFENKAFSISDYLGYGLKEVYTTNYEEFNQDKFGVNSKGAVTGVFQSYIVSGYIGVILTIILIISICNLIKEPRIRIVIAILFFWDYFFYIGLILRIQALLILLFFIIIYSNYQFEQRLYKKYINPDMGVNNRNLKTRTI